MIRENSSIKIVLIILIISAFCSSISHAEISLPRRIGMSIAANYFIFDKDFFALNGGTGASGTLRYELGYNIFFENSIGLFFAKDKNGVSVSGMHFSPTLTAVLPYFIPYRPIVRGGIGFLSANPITVTPTESFRPTQTTFYFRAGAGISRSIMENFQFELMGDMWVTPYRYRIYKFDRKDVKTSDAMFLHFMISLGITYIF